MKIINLSEQEVARHFRGSKSWLLIGNPIFKKLKCKKDYQPNPNLDEKIFAKGTEYACWICDIKNLSTGEFLHYIAQPEVAPLAKGALKGVVVPTDIFGKQSYKQEKVLVDIPDLGKYRLILGYDGYFRLIPEWHLWRQDVETFIKNKDKASHLDVQDYKIYPRIVGRTMRKAFVAYEINRRISDKLVLCSYFNTITGEEANPQVSVSCENEMLPAAIRVQKVNPNDEALPGAKFLLEWSEDGISWNPVTKSETILAGGCSSEGLDDSGCITTDNSGMAVFTGLSPMVQYRISEVATPNGYQLLKEPILVDKLTPEQNYEAAYRVVESFLFNLPKTGASDFLYLPICIAIAFTGFFLVVVSDKSMYKKGTTK